MAWSPFTAMRRIRNRRDSVMGMEPARSIGNDDSHLRLLDLPPEILLLLNHHLSSTSAFSMRLTCRTLRNTIHRPSEPHDDDTCARKAIGRYRDELDDAAGDKHRCALCKSLYPDSLFHRCRINDPAFAFVNFATADSPPLDMGAKDEGQMTPTMTPTQTCRWHMRQFEFPTYEYCFKHPAYERAVETAAAGLQSCPAGLQEELAGAGFASSIEPVCMHCGRVVVCGCSVGDCGICPCDCDSCGVRLVRCWWKLSRMGCGSTRQASFLQVKHAWLSKHASTGCGARYDWSSILKTPQERIVKCAQSSNITSIDDQ